MPAIENPITLSVNWPASKMTIAGFTRAAFNYEYSQDRSFFEKTHAGTAEGLLYNLGHSGRGMDDFPKRVLLQIPQPRQERVTWSRNIVNLVATMEFPQLYDQINDEVEKYITEVYRRKSGIFAPKPDALQREIDSLRALAEHSRDRCITVTFTPFLEDHEIKKMEGEGYRYEDRF